MSLGMQMMWCNHAENSNQMADVASDNVEYI